MRYGVRDRFPAPRMAHGKSVDLNGMAWTYVGREGPHKGLRSKDHVGPPSLALLPSIPTEVPEHTARGSTLSLSGL